MRLTAERVHPAVFSFIEGLGKSTLPLTAEKFAPMTMPVEVTSLPPEKLFPQARDAKSAQAGLFLLAGHWNMAHEKAQDIATREGSYWHAIVHRIEPDAWNSGYWFHRVGEHAIYPSLYEKAKQLIAQANAPWVLKKGWVPKQFIEWCAEARDENAVRLAEEIQRAEMDLLFEWCAVRG